LHTGQPLAGNVGAQLKRTGYGDFVFAVAVPFRVGIDDGFRCGAAQADDLAFVGERVDNSFATGYGNVLGGQIGTVEVDVEG
jgi:hypothetical protein